MNSPAASSRGARLLFRLFVIFGVILVAEVAARVAISVLAHQAVSPHGFRSSFAVGSEGTAALPESAARVGRGSHGFVPHPFLGFVTEPNRSKTRLLAQVPYPLNEFGFFDSGSPLRHRSPDRFLVGITGGSVAFFFSAEGDSELRADLERLPALAGRKVQFVRIAQAGYKQPQQLMTLEYVLSLGGELDALVNLDGFNDIAEYPVEQARLQAFPAYPVFWPELLSGVQSAAAKRAIGQWSLYEDLQDRWHAALSGPLLDRSGLATLLWIAGNHWLAARIGRAEAAYRQESSSAQSTYTMTGPRRTFASDADMYAELAGIWERSSLAMDKTCRGFGILYFHFLQPNQYVPGSKPMGAAERARAVDPAFAGAKAVREGYPVLLAAGRRLRDAGVDFTDLTGVFANVRRPLYVDTECHVDAEGSRLLADAIAARMAQRLEAAKGTSSQ